jgi:hypothetical protein
MHPELSGAAWDVITVTLNWGRLRIELFQHREIIFPERGDFR